MTKNYASRWRGWRCDILGVGNRIFILSRTNSFVCDLCGAAIISDTDGVSRANYPAIQAILQLAVSKVNGKGTIIFGKFDKFLLL